MKMTRMASKIISKILPITSDIKNVEMNSASHMIVAISTNLIQVNFTYYPTLL